MADLIDSEELGDWMKKVPEWDLDETSISRTFEFETYMEGIDFVNGVAEMAEEANHHPDMEIHFGWVEVTLSTHDQGGLTELDFGLAKKIDAFFD